MLPNSQEICYQTLRKYVTKLSGDMLPNSQEICYQTLRKYVTKFKHMRKYMVEFLRKFENRDIKMARINLNRITKSINLL